MKILVIDDDDIARELLSSTLRKAGHETYELESSIGATRCIHEQGVDAVVLDVMMPTINGDKLARMFRSGAQGRKLGIVLVSSRSQEELAALAAAAEADEVVTKGDVRIRLAAAVQRAVERRVLKERRATGR
jgi:CheY-like chemotaxis protein